MKNHEKIFKGIFIALTVLFLMISAGVIIGISLTDAVDELGRDDQIALSIVGFGVLVIIAILTAIGVLVYRDAKKLGMNAWMWLLIAIYAPNGIGIIIYLIFRYNEKQKKRCPTCMYVLNEKYEVCPQCGEQLGAACPECKKPVESDWKVCPYCRKVLKP